MNKDKGKEKDRDDKASAKSQAESAPPVIDPRNPALGEIYQRLYPEIRRPKPSPEAIAAALQSMQRLTMETDSQAAAEESALEISELAPVACSVCGFHNREGNKFCGACGTRLDGATQIEAAIEELPSTSASETSQPALEAEPFPSDEPQPISEIHPAPGAPQGAHHYHHHYHHHFFSKGQQAASAAPRANAPESAREADRLRVAAAAKGEHMSRGEAAVRRLTQEWVLACNTRHLDELTELYAPDALVLRSNLPPIRGAVAVREFFFASLESGLGEVALDPMRVEVSADLAHEVGRYSALVPGTSGKRREERGKYLWVFSRQPSGDWKLIAECWCSDLTLTSAESDIPKSAIPLATKAPTRKS